MSETYEHGHQLRALAMRVAALEDNVAYLEQWCEEQQDALDRSVGPVGCDYELQPNPAVNPRALLHVVDLRDVAGPSDPGEADADGMIVAVVETEHERRIRQIRAQLNRLRMRLAASLAPPVERPPAPLLQRPPDPRPVSAKPAGRTAP